MESKKLTPPSRLACLVLLLGLLALLAPSLRQDRANASDPCARFPQVCHYTFDPVERCCIADPKFDCFDACF